jgi:hypothetical protein
MPNSKDFGGESAEEMKRHVTILGLIYIVFGGINLLLAIAIIIVFTQLRLIIPEPGVASITVIISTLVVCATIVVSLPGIIGGIGLLKHQSWARVLVLILGIINLFNFPIGSALGIYTIWALERDETIRLFTSARSP